MKARAGLFAATATALALLCALLVISLARAPRRWSPVFITVTLQPGQSVVLGQAELAAPQADHQHLVLRRAIDGRWWAANASATKRVVLQRGSSERRIGSLAPRAGLAFSLGAHRFTVESASDGDITFSGAGARWRYDGATLYRDGQVQASCPDARLAGRAVARWNAAAPAAWTLARALTFGGNLRCANRLGLDLVAHGSATLARVDGKLLLEGGSADGERSPLILSDGAIELARAEEALDAVTAFTVGHTRLTLAIDGARAVLRPTRHVALFADTAQTLPPQVAWQWAPRALWVLPHGAHWNGALALCIALLCAYALAWQRGRWPFGRAGGASACVTSAATALLTIAGVTSLLMQRAGTPPGEAVSVVLAACTLWCCLLLPGRTSLAFNAALLLLGAGLVMQLELGLGAQESAWLRPFQKSVALLAIGLGGAAHLRLRQHTIVLPQRRLEWMLAALAAAALATLAVQVTFGDEAGVFDLQPVEFAKLALTALTAHCLAIGLGWRAQERAAAGARMLRWFRLGAPALLFAALLGLALIQVDDYSPLVLLLVWSAAMVLAYAIASGKHRLAGGLAALACCAGAGVAYLHMAGALAVAQWGFYADRFLVWLAPASHPHTGAQLLLAARAIADGAWWGADGQLGWSTLGRAAGAVLRVPALQDDFAPAFLLNRHGLLAALALWLLQALFLFGVLQLAIQQFAVSARARDFRQAWLARLRAFALCGGAAFVAGHFLLSWGTNLAIFPIMGQPMSFLSAGGSHLMFFICPLLALCAISAPSSEENQSCRSTYNTKS
ncbi:MAG: FtsW/RodA/SpoVE family cell cycle protein [Pseudomonadota bacterium]